MSPLSRPDRRYVEVEWEDAASPSLTEVISVDDADQHTVKRIVTRGWLVDENDSRYLLAAEYVGNNEFRNGTIIPKRMAISCENYGPQRRRKRVGTAAKELGPFPLSSAVASNTESAPSVETNGDPSAPRSDVG